MAIFLKHDGLLDSGLLAWGSWLGPLGVDLAETGLGFIVPLMVPKGDRTTSRLLGKLAFRIS